MERHVFVLFTMIFLAIVDDFYLQPGILSSLKQSRWWVENYPDKKYKNDYICASLIHAFSWSFMMMLPLAWEADFNVTPVFILLLGANVVIHTVVDDLKANKLRINLIQDQLIHLLQIVATFLLVKFL